MFKSLVNFVEYHPDKVLHLCVGFIISLFLSPVIGFLSMIVAMIVGLLKEWYDSRKAGSLWVDTEYFDLADVGFTVIGSVLGWLAVIFVFIVA